MAAAPGNHMQPNLLARLDALSDLLGNDQIGVGIPGFNDSFDSELTVAERLGSFRHNFGDAQSAGRIRGIDGLHLSRTFNSPVSQSPLFTRDSLRKTQT